MEEYNCYSNDYCSNTRHYVDIYIFLKEHYLFNIFQKLNIHLFHWEKRTPSLLIKTSILKKDIA